MTRKLVISILDRYIISLLIPSLFFSITICTILSELIGISFEQIKFVAIEGLPLEIMAQIHYLKLPAFLALSLPLATLMTTIIVYSKLSADSEIIALQSYGIGIERILFPTTIVALIIAMLTFTLNELVVPPNNYRAAILLEKEWQVDRTQLAKYNKREIVYQKFNQNRDQSDLELLFFADRFDGQNLYDIILLNYKANRLKTIIIANLARWNQQEKLWQLFGGHQDFISTDGFSTTTQSFDSLSVKFLPRDILDYVNHHRDLREMNLLDLYQRLALISQTNHYPSIRRLQTAIQERYAFPCSCIVFAFWGAVLGMKTGQRAYSNSLTVAAIAIFIYYGVQFLATASSISGGIPVFLGVWLPNLLGLVWSGYNLLLDVF